VSGDVEVVECCRQVTTDHDAVQAVSRHSLACASYSFLVFFWSKSHFVSF
jgi:hypothetical protein